MRNNFRYAGSGITEAHDCVVLKPERARAEQSEQHGRRGAWRRGAERVLVPPDDLRDTSSNLRRWRDCWRTEQSDSKSPPTLDLDEDRPRSCNCQLCSRWHL